MKKIILSSLLFIALTTGITKAQSTVTFSATGSVQSYTVPSNVSILSLTVAGAEGGGGGYGAVYTQTVGVTPGQVLNIYVGGAGVVGSNASGGYNGGGQAGSAYGNEGSGGGASDIRVSPYGLGDRIIVAGGGGGRGGWSGGGGGNGGLTGSAGYAGQGGGGGGGTSSSGGSGGTGNGCGNGTSGTLAIGGNGGQCYYGGGGGGGGYYGGGGGGADNNSCCADGGGGGGGSSFCSTSGGTCTTGTWTGAGRVIIKPMTGISIVQVSPVVCYGDMTAVLSATVSGGTAPYTYSWSSGATTNTLGGIGAGTYTCWIVSATAVTYSETFTVTQPAAMTHYLNSQYNLTCNGGQDGYLEVYVYGGAYPYTYTWTPAGGNYYYAYALSAGMYTCYIQDANGCTVTRTATLTQPPAPSIVAGASSNSVCAGGTVTLVGAGAYYYSWNNGVSDGVAFAPTTSTTYIVAGTDYNGCTGYAQVSVQVVPNPTVSINVPATACAGASTTLSATGANSYVWSNGSSLATTVVTPTATTQYVVAGTNSLGCTNNASVSVNVYALPSLYTIYSASAVCLGQTVTLTATGANSFTWSPSITNGVAFQPTATTIYTVSATDGYGCVSNKTSTVVVNPLPVLSVTGATSMCQGQSVTLAGNGASSYTWNTGSNASSISVSPQITTIYSLTGANASGCAVTSQFNLSVFSAPNVFASTASTLVCYGSVATLQANGAASYTWYPMLSGNTSVSVTPIIPTTYTVIGLSNGCYSTSIISLSVIPVPTLALTGPTSVCALTNATVSASGASSYTWITGATTSSAVVSGSATCFFAVAGSGANGCIKKDSILIVMNPLPALHVKGDSTICEGGSASLTVSGSTSYSWSTNETGSSIVVNPLSSTPYSVSSLGSNGCSRTVSFLVTVSPCTKISETSLESTLSIYPNPNDGLFYVFITSNLQLRLVNNLGQHIQHFEVKENTKQLIEVQDLPAGVYFITGKNQSQFINQKIIITKP